MKSITIIDQDYKEWVNSLVEKYRKSQIKAAVRVNTEMLKFYWNMGRDIVEMHAEERWGQSVIVNLSHDFREALPNVDGLSKSNIYYCRKFYQLYNPNSDFFHQTGGILDEEEFFHQVGGIFEIPWKHHCLIMDKVKGDIEKLYSMSVRQSIMAGAVRFCTTGLTPTCMNVRVRHFLTLSRHCLRLKATWPSS